MKNLLKNITLNSVEHLFGIKKNQWNAEIQVKNLKKSLKLYWNKTGIPNNNIKLQYNKKVKAENGVCVLNIYNSSLAEVFYYIFEYCKKLSIINSK